MIKFLYSFLFLLSVSQLSFGQEKTKPLFMERTNDSLVRLFYDENYYLIDKNSEFKTIERVVNLKVPTRIFDGPFKDFNNDGRLILEGKYNNGKKVGIYTAYHPNGAKKWETEYQNDSLVNYWNYYYPDGKPMLFLNIKAGTILFDQYWEQDGKQTLHEGNGEYNIILPIFGFTEHGFSQYRIKGTVKNGFPEGRWMYSFIEQDRKRSTDIFAVRQDFRDGELVNEVAAQEFASIHLRREDFELTPTSFFVRAELFEGKDGSFDQYTGFNAYLAEKLTNLFNQTIDQGNNILESFEKTLPINYQIRVYKSGTPNKPYGIATPPDITQTTKRTIEQVAMQIPYYLPSFLNQKAINDILTISFQLKKTSTGKIMIEPVQISREKGH